MTIRSFLANLPANEPVLIAQAVSAGLVLAASFGWHLDATQIAEAAGIASAVTALVIRPHVTPNGKLNLSAEITAAAPVAAEIVAAIPTLTQAEKDAAANTLQAAAALSGTIVQS